MVTEAAQRLVGSWGWKGSRTLWPIPCFPLLPLEASCSFLGEGLTTACHGTALMVKKKLCAELRSDRGSQGRLQGWPEGGRTRPTMPAFSPTSAQPGLELFPGCMESCSCPSDDFNPVCDSSTRVEYITPCHAGCTSRVVQEVPDKSQVGQASGCPSASHGLCSLCLCVPVTPSTSECPHSLALLSVYHLSSPSVGRYRMLFFQ